MTRAGELVGTTVAARLGVPFGCVNLSLAPSPVPGGSVGEVRIEAMGLERVGVPARPRRWRCSPMRSSEVA